MAEMPTRHIFVIGPPRCGKSTLIERVVARLGRPATGFFTREIREGGRRVGFAITTLDGKRGILAHEEISSRCRVGRYGVNLEDIDRIAVPVLVPTSPGDLVVVDEIGKMECFSRLFRETLIRVLNSGSAVLGSIALKGNPFIEEIKRRHDVSLIHLSERSREDAFASVLEHLKR
jgi:nucleoside-triphosphatase THEP1